MIDTDYIPLRKHFIIPYPCESGPTTECWPTPHFGLDFLLRSSVYSNMRLPLKTQFKWLVYED